MAVDQYTLILPWKIDLLAKKKANFFFMNLNQYRNTHHHSLAKSKVLFTEMVKKSVLALPKINKAILTYKIYPGSRTRIDTNNVVSITDKYFSDALTELGIIPDDDYRHIIKVIAEFGEVSPNNPHVTVTIDVIEYQEEKPLRMLFTNSDLKSLLIATAAAALAPGTTFSVEFTGEGDELEANVIINSNGANNEYTGKGMVAEKPKAAIGNRRLNKPKTAEKPVEPDPVVEPDVDQDDNGTDTTQPEAPEDNPIVEDEDNDDGDNGDSDEDPAPVVEEPKKVPGIFSKLRSKTE